MCLSCIDDNLFGHDRVIVRCHTKLDIRGVSQVAEADNFDAVLAAQLVQSDVSIVRVALDLKGGGHDLSVALHLMDHQRVNVRDANVANETFSVQLFHGVISLLVSNFVVEDHSWGGLAGDFGIVVLPLRWVLSVERHEGERNREVDVVKIEVVKTKVLKRLSACSLDILGTVVGIPKLGDNEQLSSSNNTLIDCALDTLAYFDFVTIVASAIEVTVAILDGGVNDLGAHILRHLPKAEPDDGHLSARAHITEEHLNYFG